MEIVGHEPALMYESEEDAARKISAVLADSKLQDRLRAGLSIQAERFATDRFVREVREIVNSFEP